MLETGAKLLHAARLAVLLGAGWCGVLQASGSAMTDPSATTPAPHSFTLGYGKKLTLPGGGLTVQFTQVKDSRCPKGVTCIWAGHAAVTLRVGQPGHAAQAIVIGTAAPANMNLPHEANYASYRFSLLALEPDNSPDAPVPAKRYRARIQVSAL